MIQLNVKSEFSMLNSICKIPDLVKKAQRNGMSALAIADINNMHGVRKFALSCKKAEIHSILGLTVYYEHNGGHFSLELYAKDADGYLSLINIATEANMDEKAVPCISFDKLKEYNKGLICLTGGIAGELYTLFDRENEADAFIDELCSIYGKENIYIECTSHRVPREDEFLKSSFLHKLVDNGFKPVATNHVYYMQKEHDLHRSLAVSMTAEPEKIAAYSPYVDYNNEFYFKTPKEMEASFAPYLTDYPDLLDNTDEIAQRCQAEVLEEKLLPAFPLPDGYTSESYLKKLAWEGLHDRKPEYTSEEERKVYEDRLQYEYDVILKMGFTDYFLIVQDYINWSKDPDVYKHPERYFPGFDLTKVSRMCIEKDFRIEVGPGRGSAAGSLLAYSLRITNLDPIKYDLLFERFLNIERVSMPDIDVDFSNQDREKVIEFTQNKYGYDCVSQIATFQTLGLKSIIKALSKAVGIPYAKADMITKNIPNKIIVNKEKDDGSIEQKEKEPEFLSEIENLEFFKNIISKDSDIKNVFNMGKVLEGLPKSTGKHAAGVIIGRRSLRQLVPMMEVDGVLVTQFEKGDSEDTGLLKMDFLGLQTLDIEQKTKDLVREEYGIEIDLDTIPIDDKAAYELFQTGNTGRVFQFEGAGMKNLLKKMHPTSLEHLNAACALYRPGPMEFIPDYLKGRKDESSILYPHEKFREVTHETYGILVYQEQIMSLVQKMAGFSLGQADILRRGIGKKIEHYLVEGRQQFIDGAKNLHGIDEKTSNDIYDTIVKFANYGFNKSHSCAYAYISYQTAYLKAHYLECFMAANLTIASQDKDKVAAILAECKRSGIEILPPDVEKSQGRFTVEKQEDGHYAIRYGLAAINSISDEFADMLMHIPHSSSLQEFIAHVPYKYMRKGQFESLIDSGALDSFGIRKVMNINLRGIIEFEKLQHRIRGNGYESFLNGLPQIGYYDGYEYPSTVKVSKEKEAIHVSLSEHILESYRSLYPNVDVISDILIDDEYDDQDVSVLGLVRHIQRITTKKGQEMCFIDIEDETSEIEGIMFPRDYDKIKESIMGFEGMPALIRARYQIERQMDENNAETEKKTLIISDLKPLAKESTLYLDASTIPAGLLESLSDHNGISSVMVIDASARKGTLLPFCVNLNKVEELLKGTTYKII